MAAIDYTGILEAIAAAIEADTSVKEVAPRMLIETDPMQGVVDDGGRVVVILLDSRSATTGQSLSAGKRQRYTIRISIWCMGLDMSDFLAASRKRDDLLGRVEIALMAARQNLGTLLDFITLQGGEFMSAVNPGNAPPFGAMGQIILEAQASAISS